MSAQTNQNTFNDKIIFYLEDEKFTNESTTFMLTKFFKNVHSFEKPQDALAKIEEGINPDLIMTDIEMPGMNGIDFVKHIREIGFKKIPIIFVTAYNDTQYLKAALDFKVEKYITKPIIHVEEVINTITKALEKYEINKLKDTVQNTTIFTRTDTTGKITHVSQSFCDLSGYDKDELIGNSHSLVRHQSMPKDVYKDLWRTIKKGKVWKGEIKNKAKDGNPYWIEHTITPEYADNGSIIGYVSVSSDISAKKSFEEEHIKILQEAKLASIEELLENISHQWRQPLSLISISAGRLDLDLDFKTLTDEQKKELLDKIVESTQFLSQTIEKFNKYISNDKKLTSVNILEEIEYAKEVLKNSLEINKIELIEDIDYSKKIQLDIVQNEISQILINLITNSKEAILKKDSEEKRYIKIGLQDDEETICLSVEDNGCGIDEKILPKIFDPYFTTKFQAQGTGLGLHLTHRIVTESLNGNIKVKNIENGTKFTIYIPKIDYNKRLP